MINTKKTFLFLFISIWTFYQIPAQVPRYDQTREGFLVFHPIKTDREGKIIPWYSDDLGKAFDFTVKTVWSFWDTMRTDLNGLPYYMNHQVWRPENDPRGLGGDQLAMALSSWKLLYQYTGNERVKENMKFIADYYLTHALSSKDAAWSNIPYPYNSLLYSGFYDGDMVIGRNFTQPDKAGSFGIELLHLYKIVSQYGFPHATEEIYLEAAIDIANTLAQKTKAGDYDNSPMPFKVSVVTGEVGVLKSNEGSGKAVEKSSYTTNWVGTLQLFQELIQLNKGNVIEYQKAFNTILDWMKKYPLQNNRWGPFFEDIPGWSDTQINAITFARFMMENQALFPEWKMQVPKIFDWVYEKLGNDSWQKYGVIVVNEQTVYQTPGNSHTSRQAAAELLYASLSNNNERTQNAIRALSWATYMVDNDGKNNYPRDEVWLTDGYGDYVRHYLRAMAVRYDLAPSDQNHILHSTSIISQAGYTPDLNKRLSMDVPLEELSSVRIYYRTFDKQSVETLRMTTKPAKVLVNNKQIAHRQDLSSEGWTWQAMQNGGGVLKIRHDNGSIVKIF